MSDRPESASPADVPAPDDDVARAGVRGSLRTIAARAAAEVAQGVATARAARLAPPAPGAGRLARVGYGFGLPFAILRAVWADPTARRAYLRVVLRQLAMALAVTAAIVALNHDSDRSGRGTHVNISNGNVEIVSLDEVSSDEAQDETGEPDGIVQERREVEARKVFPSTADKADAAKADAAKAQSLRGWLRAHMGAAVAFWSEAIATLAVVEWIIIALSREYHDALSKTASELTSVPPEDTPVRPSIRVNLAWLWKKAKRRFRGAMLFALGAPPLWVLFLLPRVGRTVQSVLITVWTAYWIVVFTAAKTEHAWSCASPPDPWFLRYGERASKHPWLRYWLWPWYVRLLRRVGGQLASPAAHVEKAPYETIGLATARALTRVPGLYTFFRPIIPVAATHVVTGPGRIDPDYHQGC